MSDKAVGSLVRGVVLAGAIALFFSPAAFAFYYPPGNTPPGPPPNYTQIDSSYFEGAPVLPVPPPDAGGFYIWRDQGRWTIVNHIYSKGNSHEQFHGSVLAILDQPPQLNVNVTIRDFELFGDTTANLCLDQNDRWGWVEWGPNLYEIWWDVTTKEDKTTGQDLNDIIEITIAGCALDFNLWSSAHGSTFGEDQIYLGADVTPLSSVPEYIDFFDLVFDPYQSQAGSDPQGDPNITIFTPKALPGAAYNRYGLIAPDAGFPCDPDYGLRYAGTFAYEGNGIQFSTNCISPENQFPGLDFPGTTLDTVYANCPGDPVCVVVIASDPDPGDTITLSLLSGPVTYAPRTDAPPIVDTICFVPDTSGAYLFVWQVEDAAGAFTVDSTHIVVLGNQPPQIVLPADTSVRLCLLEPVCLEGIFAFDPDSAETGPPTLQMVSDFGLFDPEAGRLCFFPADTGGTYRFIFEACDTCPAACVRDTFLVQIELNRPPTVKLPDDTTIVACDLGEICLGPAAIVDPDGDELTVTGIGADFQDGHLCFLPEAPGAYYVGLSVADPCGPAVRESLLVNVVLNEPPHFDLPDTIQVVACGLGKVCLPPIEASDLESDAILFSLLEGPGQIDPATGVLCVVPELLTSFQVIIAASDSCGSRVDSAHVVIVVNQPPVWVYVPDTTVYLCTPGDSICVTWTAEDPDGDPLIGPLPEICFVPDSAGTYLFFVSAQDSCNPPIEDTVRVQVRFNGLPELAFSYPDTTIHVCDPDTLICFDVSALDPDGDQVTLREILNPGTFDAESGTVCFNPADICFGEVSTVDTTICLKFGASDTCGIEVVDSLCLTFVRNRAPSVELPADTALRACGPGPVCLEGVVTGDLDGDLLVVTTSAFATYDDGTICFDADTAGTYLIEMCVTDPCGASACDTISVEILFDTAPIVHLPADFKQVLCAPGTFCFDPLEISDGDGDSLQIQVTGGTWNGSEICVNAPDAGTFSVIVEARDACGLVARDTVNITVAHNSAPKVLIKSPQPLTLCTIDTVLCYPIKVSDLDGVGTATLRLVKTDMAVWSIEGNRLCLDASVGLAGRSVGFFEAIVEAEDPCGAKGRDTIAVTLRANQAPIAVLPPDSQAVLCGPGQICVTLLELGDPDGDPATTTVTGGVLDGQVICAFIDRDTLLVLSVTATDSCGLSATDTMRVAVTVNKAPTVVLPDLQPLSLCAFDTVCVDGLVGQDPDVGTIPLTQIAGDGQFDPQTGRLCFTPENDGIYAFTFVAADGCAADTATLAITISANRPPEFGESPAVSRFVCFPGDSICLQFAAVDGEGDPVHYELESGPGSLDLATGLLCFVPEASGMFTFVVSAADSCGIPVYDTGHADIVINRPPVLTFTPQDTTIFVCSTDTTLCFEVTASDPDGETPTIREILNPGAFDPETGVFCFNPADICFGEVCSEDTTICLIFAATDSCGAETIDSMCVRVLANRPPVVELGADTSLSICEPAPFCLPLGEVAFDPDLDFLDFTVAAPGYNLENQEACIDLDTTGRYALIVCATDPCGLSSCDTLWIDVVVNTPPIVHLPGDSTVIACSADSVCIPYTVSDVDPGDQLSVHVTGDAVLHADRFCFVPGQGDGVYSFILTATDLCGNLAVDTVAITVDVNDPPLISFSSPDTSISVCNPDTELCFVVTAVDPDGDSPLLEEVLVPGFYNPENGTFCFNPDSICFTAPQTTDTTICVVFKATDACGAVTYDSLCVTVIVNKPPAVHFSVPDTNLFLCNPDTLLCFDVWGSDPEGDLVVISEVRNPGAYFPETGQFCFNPDSICFTGTSFDTTFCVIFKATDACGNSTIDSLCLGLFANHPPVVEAPDTVDVVICAGGEEVCISPVTALDPEQGLLPVTAPGATYDDLMNSLCFVADSVGTYLFEATATDSCLAQGSKTIVVHVAFNRAPGLTTPGDTSVFLCGPGPVCFDWSLSDPDGDTLALSLSTDQGTAYIDTSSGQLCVLFGAGGLTTLVNVVVTDPCGATASRSFAVSTQFNRPPAVTLPADFEVKACAEGEYCFGPVQFQDPDGNFGGEQITVSGGRFDFGSQQICADVTGPGSYTVIVSATDSCGATGSDTVTLTVTVNGPPVTAFSVPDTALFLCQPDTELCFYFSATDPDLDLITLNEILNPGTFDAATGRFCFNPAEVCFNNPDAYDTVICVIFAAIDDCGATTYDTLCLELTANALPVVTAPLDTAIGVCQSGSVCLAPFMIADPNGDKDTLQIVVTGPPHQFDTATGVICFEAGAGTYTFVATAADRCGETATDSIRVTIAPNSPPSVSLPADYSVVVCPEESVCFPVSVSDPDVGDSVTVTVTGGGAYNPQTGEICFAPGAAGEYVLIATATDRCGAQQEDTIQVTVTLNSPPVWLTVPAIDSFFCAPPDSFCFTVTALDPDDQMVRYALVSGPGSIDSLSGEICFVPGPSTQAYTFVVSARDACGASTLDTASVNIRVNRAPVLVPPPDTSAAQCAPGQLCFFPLGVSDPDDDPVTLQILSGPGTLNGNQLCFLPDTPGLAIYCFTVRGTDPCGKADTINFCAQVRVNRPPAITAPPDFTEFLCDSAQVCFSGVSALDADGDPVTLTMTAGPGTFNAGTGQVCFAPAKTGGVYTFAFRASDPCASRDQDTVVVTVKVNSKPSLLVPTSIANCLDNLICIPISVTDPDAPQTVSITQVSGPAGSFSPNPLSGFAPLSGQWCWTPTGTGDFTVVFQATDDCGVSVLDTTLVRVEAYCDTLCFESRIALACPDTASPSQWMFQGRTTVFPVTTKVSRPIGAFDFLIGFDATALSLLTVTPGAGISAWEFFTFRIVDPSTTCSGICPSGLVRIVGIADINNGSPLSDSSQILPGPDPREFANVQFLVSNDRTLAGQFVPVTFWWNDCGDNTFSSPQGDLYVASDVDPDTCITGGKELITSCALFFDGGGCIPRATDIDERGDLNLNGIAYEIADAVLYSNYFISGPSVLDLDPTRRESQIAASDINGDGAPLTVADLVFLIRIILGLEHPIDDSDIGGPKIQAGDVAQVYWTQSNDRETSVAIKSPAAVGAAAFQLTVNGSVDEVIPSSLVQSSGLTLEWEQQESTLRILLYSLKGAHLPALDGPIAFVKGGVTVKELSADLSDDRGRTLGAEVHKSIVRPDVFRLGQNYPNPFNPETEIRFTLNRQAAVRLTVFNLLGRPVATLVDGQTLVGGEYVYRWLARDEWGKDLPSGVYMYRLDADDVSETRKMLLLR